MPDIKALSDHLKTIENLISACTRCGACQSVCPLFSQTGREADVARGKLALLDGLIEEMFENPKGAYQRLERCLLCGSCEKNCASGVHVLEIFIKARAILREVIHLPKTQRAALRHLLAQPETFDSLVSRLAKCQHLFIKQANIHQGTSCARVISPLLSSRHFKPLADVPFHRMCLPQILTAKRKEIKVAFFTGCLIDKVFPEVAMASVHALNHHGIEVMIPMPQGCCGIPSISSGDTGTFHELVRYNIERFASQNFDVLVTACATCAFTIKKIWPMMFQSASQNLMGKVKETAEKTMDISQFLVSQADFNVEKREKIPKPALVTYHDPCHLKKSLGVYREPRMLIEASPLSQFIEMPNADTCCGMGGSFNLKYYTLSTEVGKQKAANIICSSSSIVATGCPACMLHISDLLSKSDKPIAVKHAIEIYADSIKSF